MDMLFHKGYWQFIELLKIIKPPYAFHNVPYRVTGKSHVQFCVRNFYEGKLYVIYLLFIRLPLFYVLFCLDE